MTEIRHLLQRVLQRGLLIDLEDRLRAEAIQAHKMVRDHAGLDQKRSRELVGQARFRMMEKGFEEVCSEYGGNLLDGGFIPQTELKIFQPYMRFEQDGKGVILGLASMPEPSTIPAKNKSRLAAVSLNFGLSPQLDLDGTGPKIGDVFALFLTSRDRHTAGEIEEIAVGVIDSAYEAFLSYTELGELLAGYVSGSDNVTKLNVSPSPQPTVTLKNQIKPFVPPEDSESTDDKSTG